MKKILAVSALSMAALAIVGCGKKEGQQNAQTIQEIQAVEGIPVKVEEAVLGTIRHIEKTSGTAEGFRQTYLANGMGGTLQNILVKTGQRVKDGEVVASMFFEDGSPRTVAQANYDYAERMYERVKRLSEEGAATQEQVEGARVQYENAAKGLKGARVAEFITAPFSGVVLEIYQSVGTKIDARTPIVHLADFSKIKIDAMVNELNINKYSAGQKAFVLVDDQDTIWGKAISVAVGAVAQTHSFRVTFEFPNPENKLKVGMFKEIFVIIEERKNAISVPIDVIVYRAGQPGIFVIKDGHSKLRHVEMGIKSGNNVEIKSGLKEGDEYVFAGMTLLSNGTKIKITE